MKILFLVKTTQEYGDVCQVSKSGLRNSAKFVVDEINKFEGIDAYLEFCKDGNEIDKYLYKHRPDLCIIEAVWVEPKKLNELIGLYPTIKFITRVHSKIPFLAMEGNALAWLKEYEKVSIISFNHEQTSCDLNKIGLNNIYLPNIYPYIEFLGCEKHNKQYLYKVGCFGSIRPFKNQLNQAVSAILFAENRKSIVHFYINSTRVEQHGNSVLKSIRYLFENTRHKLIECDWLNHDDFLELIGSMDVNMQVSFTETFNIVTADSISQHIPIVVSPEIEWLSCCKANPNNADDIARVLAHAIDYKHELVEDNIHDLTKYNHSAIMSWFRYLKRD